MDGDFLHIISGTDNISVNTVKVGDVVLHNNKKYLVQSIIYDIDNIELSSIILRAIRELY